MEAKGILDDFSRYVIAWKLCTTMKTEDVTDTLEMALTASGCDQVHIQHKPRLLSDNGSSYISEELAEWLDGQRESHVRGAPYHPQTQGKIERWHQTLKNRILLENYYLPRDLEMQIAAFIEHYNHRRYHESLENLTPLTFTSAKATPSCSNGRASNETPSHKDACFTKSSPLKINQPDEAKSPLNYALNCPICFDDTPIVIVPFFPRRARPSSQRPQPR